MICAFTGHRPGKLPWGDREADPRCLALKVQIAQAVARARKKGTDIYACGLARGCDFYFFETVLTLRKTDPLLRLEAWLPCPEQADRWPEADRVRYTSCLRQCDAVHVLEPTYSPGCMLRRNRAMLDRADLLISVYDGTGGGTGAAVAYAKRRGIPVDALWR